MHIRLACGRSTGIAGRNYLFALVASAKFVGDARWLAHAAPHVGAHEHVHGRRKMRKELGVAAHVEELSAAVGMISRVAPCVAMHRRRSLKRRKGEHDREELGRRGVHRMHVRLADGERLAEHAAFEHQLRRPSPSLVADAPHHRPVVGVPVGKVPHIIGKNWEAPEVVVFVGEIAVRLRIERTVPGSAAVHRRARGHLVLHESIHFLPVAVFRVEDELYNVAFPRGGASRSESDSSVLYRLAGVETDFSAAHEGESGDLVDALSVELYLDAVVFIRDESFGAHLHLQPIRPRAV